MATQGAYGPPGAELQRLYDAEAVDRYVGQLQAHISDLQRQVAEAVHAAHEAQSQAASADNAERLLGRALLNAQRAADDMIADAERRAQVILADARLEADRILGDVRADAQRIVDEAHETVEAVFAALATREAAPEPAPSWVPAAPPPPPPPPPPPAPAAEPMWAPPPPDSRQALDDEEEAEGEREPEPAPVPPWQPPATAAAEPDDGPEGTIVDLRPGRLSGPLQPESSEHPTVTRLPDDDWGSALGGTGTEGRPLTVPDAPPPAEATVPETIGRPAGGDLLERWSLARYGARSLGDDDVLTRQSHLESLADGSYVEELRSDPADGGGPRPGGEPWTPHPPPAGPPLEIDTGRSWLRRRRL